MAKILVIDDDAELNKVIRDWLEHEHYTVECLEKGVEALEYLVTFQYDLIILDIGLPDISGLEVCDKYRAGNGRAPILMLTGKDDIADKERGLDAGADDYLTKPFEVRELSARVRALLRRPPSLHSNFVQAGPITLDPASHKVTRNGDPIQVFPRDFALLEFLMRHADSVFGAEALINHVWHSDTTASSESVRTAIKRLRKSIDLEGQESFIETVYGVGYKFRT